MIVVTGATGFVGTYLIDQLVSEGIDVLACGRSKTGQEYYNQKKVPFQHLEVGKRKDFDKLPKKDVDAVIHLAAVIPEHRSSNISGSDLMTINGIGTWNALDYCRENKINKIVYTTSHYEVSNVKKFPIKEDVIDFINKGDHVEYVIAKIAGAQYVQYFSSEYGMQGVILRTTCLRGYNKYAAFHKDANICRSHWENFIHKAYHGEPIEVWGDCTTYLRDHLYVKDAVSCIITAMKSDKAIGRYNMASGKGISFDDEIKTIVKVFSSKDHPSRIIYKPEKQNNIDRGWIHDITKTKKDLNWSPRYSTEAYLEDIKREMEKDGYLKK